MAEVDIRVNSKADLKGFKQAETAAMRLTKSVKQLGGAFGIAFGARAVINYGKASLKAFAADDKAVKVLSRSLENLGLAFADPAVKTFISDLENQYHVLDDKLRPAYQKLLTTTGDWRKSQDLLKTALDLSAMSGEDVVSVADDLSRAYVGNTKGLQKYGLGLSKTQLAAMSFEEILTAIAKISKGQATEAANTFAGALDALNVSAENAKETIGKGLVQAFTEASGAQGIGAMQNGIADLAAGISDAIIGTERLVKLFLMTADFDFKGAINFYKETKKADMLARQVYGGAAANTYIAQAQAAADKKAKANAAAQLAILNKQKQAQADILKKKQLGLAIDKANLALGKGSDVFNMDAIQVNAALISQAEQLGKATSSAQLLAIANDVARLNVKKSMYELEQAIASGDIKAIEAATTKLNKDVEILGALQNQKYTVTQIANILNALKPKELIDIENLKLALALLAQLKIPSLNVPGAVVPPPGGGGGGGGGTGFIQGPNGISPTTLPKTLEEVNAAVKDLGGVVTVIGQNGKEFTALVEGVAQVYQGVEDSAAYNSLVKSYMGGAINSFNSGSLKGSEGSISTFSGGGAYDKGGTTVNITVQGSLLSEQDLVQVVQNAVQTNNKYGNNLNVAGSL
jgi:hypothetical protein